NFTIMDSSVADHLALEHIYGNFHDYYDFNPESERLRFLTSDVRHALRQHFYSQPNAQGTLLDVGCNEGKLTMGLFDALTRHATSSSPHDASPFTTDSLSQLNDLLQPHQLRPEYITIADTGTAHRPQFVLHVYIYGVFFGQGSGVSKKVARAKAASVAMIHWRRIHHNISPTSPTKSSELVHAANPTSACNDDNTPMELKVLGIDIDNVLIDKAKSRWPNHPHVSFMTGDIMTPSEARAMSSMLTSRPRFDVVTCFSVTMWIHLNHGDAGLSTFLDTISNIAAHLIVEPQPWKCYRAAIARLKRMHIQSPFGLQALTFTHEHVTTFIDSKLSERFPFRKLMGKTNWSRHVWLYSRVPLPGVVYEARKGKSDVVSS
ncbi:hypothetical protein DYB28_007821, partial [Aphanomyces astaci]